MAEHQKGYTPFDRCLSGGAAYFGYIPFEGKYAQMAACIRIRLAQMSLDSASGIPSSRRGVLVCSARIMPPVLSEQIGALPKLSTASTTDEMRLD